MNHYIPARAARILIIINECGEKSDLPKYVKVFRSITRLEKFEFLLRYPDILGEIVEAVSPDLETPKLMFGDDIDQPNIKENNMARMLGMEKWRYGPFDRECYNAFGYLEMKCFIKVISSNSREDFYLMPEGERLYLEELINSPIHAVYIERAKIIKKHLSHFNATRLKNFLYEKYPHRIGEAQMGELIK